MAETRHTGPDAVTVAGQRAVYSPSGRFTTGDLDALVSGPGIPPGARIVGYVSAATVIIDRPAILDLAGTVLKVIPAGWPSGDADVPGAAELEERGAEHGCV